MKSSGGNTAAFTSATDLTPNSTDPSAYVLNGTGIQLAAVDTDLLGTSRPTTVAAGAPDLGAYELTLYTSTSPNPLEVTGASSPGGPQTFSLNGRPLVTLNYGTTGTVPSNMVARYYSGINPPPPHHPVRQHLFLFHRRRQ